MSIEATASLQTNVSLKDITSIELADIVISLNGRDVGKQFIVIETDTVYSLLADGKGRRYEKPKRKKNKHMKFQYRPNNPISEKLKSGEKVTNNEIRRFLAEYSSLGGM